ncbi:MAG: phage scaffolding protein [Muribaculaceae bacterium]|nr:phage scaffolding protein [Muribaculaceae bacterium]
MLEWLKGILGDSYTEEIDKKISEELGRRMVAKVDFDAKNTELKAARAQLADAGTTIEGLRAEGKDIETLRREVEEYKTRAAKAEQDAAAQLEDYKFNSWFDGLVAKHKGRDAAVIRALAGDERMQALRESKNRDEDGKALFADLMAGSAYAFDTTPPPPLYAAGTGSASVYKKVDGVESAFAAMNPSLNLEV